MLWIGGPLTKKGLLLIKWYHNWILRRLCQKPGRIESRNVPLLAKMFLISSAKPGLFLPSNDGFGFVNSSGRLVYDNIGKQPIVSDGKRDAEVIETEKR
jgi:hypothetical protein